MIEIDKNKLWNLLDANKKHLLYLGSIDEACSFINPSGDEEKLAKIINSGEFLSRLVDFIDDVSSHASKLREELNKSVDKMLGSEQERLEYLRSMRGRSWIIQHKITRGLRLTDEESEFLQDALLEREAKLIFPNANSAK